MPTIDELMALAEERLKEEPRTLLQQAQDKLKQPDADQISGFLADEKYVEAQKGQPSEPLVDRQPGRRRLVDRLQLARQDPMAGRPEPTAAQLQVRDDLQQQHADDYDAARKREEIDRVAGQYARKFDRPKREFYALGLDQWYIEQAPGEGPSLLERGVDAASAFGSSAVDIAVEYPLKFGEIASEAFDDFVVPPPALKGVGPTPPGPFGQAATAVGKLSDAAFPRIRKAEETIPSKVAGAVGSIAGFAGPLAATKVLGIPKAVGAMFAGGVAEGTGLYEEAIAHGATKEDARIAALYGIPLGMVEGVTAVRIVGRIHKMTGGAFRATWREYAAEKGKDLLASGIENGLQEMAQQLGGNVAAKKLVGYDKNREYFAGVGESGGLGSAAAVIVTLLGLRGGRGAGGDIEVVAEDYRTVDPEGARKLAGIESPSRADFKGVTEEQTTKEDRQRFAGLLRDAYAKKEADHALPEQEEAAPEAAKPKAPAPPPETVAEPTTEAVEEPTSQLAELESLNKMKPAELRAAAAAKGLKGYKGKTRKALINLILHGPKPRAEGRASIKEAEQAVLDIHERAKDIITGEDPGARDAALSFEDHGDDPREGLAEEVTNWGYSFKETGDGVGISNRNQVRDAIPHEYGHLKKRVTITKERQGDEDLLTTIPGEHQGMADAIVAHYMRERGPTIERTVKFVHENPELFSAQEFYDIRKYAFAKQSAETAKLAKGKVPEEVPLDELAEGDKMTMGGEEHIVTDVAEDMVAIEDGGPAMVLPRAGLLAIDKGSLEQVERPAVEPAGPEGDLALPEEGDESFAFGENAPKLDTLQAKAEGDFAVPVSMEPVAKGKPPAPEAIIATMEHDWGVPIRTGRIPPHAAKAAGIYKVKAAVARLRGKIPEPLAVAAHEVAHHIDKTTGIVAGMPADVSAEVGWLNQNSEEPDPTEGFAEYLRLYWTTNDAPQKAPATHAWFTEEWLPAHPDEAAKIAKHRDLMSHHRAAGAVGRGLAQMKPDRRPMKPVGVPALTRAGRAVKKATYRFYAAMKDDNTFLQDYVKEAKKRGYSPDKGETSYELAMAFSLTGPAQAQYALETAVNTLGEQPRKVGPSYRQVFEGLLPEDQKDDRFGLYIYAKQAQEAWGHGINPGISKADADAIVEELQNPRMEKSRQTFQQFMDGLLEVQVDAGVVAPDAAARMKAKWKMYAPLSRIEHRGEVRRGRGGGSARGLSDLPPGVHARLGSNLPVVNPINSAVERALSTYRRAMAQIIVNRIFEEGATDQFGTWFESIKPGTKVTSFSLEEIKKQLIAQGMNEEAIDEVEDPESLLFLYRPDFGKRGNRPIIGSRGPDGKMRLAEIDPHLWRAIMNVDAQQYGPVIRIFAAATRMAKLGMVGLNQVFGVRNLLKDWGTYMMQGKYAGAKRPLGPAIMIGEYIWSEGQVAAGKPGDPYVRLYQQYGGEMSQYIGMDRNWTRIKKAVARSKNQGKLAATGAEIVKHPIDALRSVVSTTEVASRLPEAVAVLKKHGWTRERIRKEGPPPRKVIIEAMNAANDITVNFKRMGYVTRQINLIAPFFNAKLEGLDKFGRTWKDNPTGTFMRVAVLAAGTWAYWLTHRDKEWRKHMPDWAKYGYWTIDDENGKPLYHIPIPFEWGWLGKAGVEAILDFWHEKDPEILTGYLKEAGRSINPISYPALLQPGAESAFNYDLFRDRPIVGKGKEGLEDWAQATPWNTELMKAVGEYLDMSPARLEHAVEGYTGGLYGRTARLAERAIEGRKAEEGEGLLLGPAFEYKEDRVKEVDEFYKLTDKVRRRANTQRKHEGEVDQATKDEFRRLDAVSRLLSDIRNVRGDIRGRDERFKFNKYIYGTAIEAMGGEKAERYPSLLSNPKGAPESLTAVRNRFLGSRVYSVLDPAGSKDKDRAVEKKRLQQVTHKDLRGWGVTRAEAERLLAAEAKRRGFSTRRVKYRKDGSRSLTAFGERMNRLKKLWPKDEGQ